ncbi:MAG: hypothetical protein RLZ98_1317 [Pseudomonadota bacterium]
MSSDPEAILRTLFSAAVTRADPSVCVPRHLPPAPYGRTIVVGAGKAAAAMARAVELNWPGELQGVVVTRYGHGVPCERIRVIEAGHPIPDDAGFLAASAILEAVENLSADDMVIALMSGGASSLLALPAGRIMFADKQSIARALLKSGARISEINTVRRHLSGIKGGRLLKAAWPAQVVTLAISDVPGDILADIGSGPTVPDPTTLEDARKVLHKYGIDVPARVMEHLADIANETPKAMSLPHKSIDARLVATPAAALEAAAEKARELGLEPVVLGANVEGQAREIAEVHAALARQARAGQVILSGGELTVTMKGRGRGGPNGEYALALALALDGRSDTWAIACDSDGIDGTEDNAGAFIGPDTIERAAALGNNGRAMLNDNDSYGFFASLGDLVVTGPTLTNVNDFRAILVA